MFLVEDIIIEILSRLPVESLLKFKCVCKEWCKLIMSPEFISKHFNGETNHSRLLVQYLCSESKNTAPPQVKDHFALFLDKDLKDTPPAYEDFYKLLLIGQIFGPVNGLFFLHRDLYEPHDCPGNPVALWNPATRQLRRIIYPKPIIPSHCVGVFHSFGFGFDCSSNDYKVIWFRTYMEEMSYINIEVTIYSLSKDSWSSPVTMICRPYNTFRNTFINGAYYWFSWHRTDRETNSLSILSFDMASELFRDIELPGCGNLFDYSPVNSELMLYNDHLAMLSFDSRSHNEVLWIMEEEGCWIKLLTIGFQLNWGLPKGMWKNNEFLIPDINSKRLQLYNVDSCETKDLGLESLYSFYTYSYKESLVSVEGGTEDWLAFDCDARDCKHMQLFK